LFDDLFYILKEISNLAICCYKILVMEFLGCYTQAVRGKGGGSNGPIQSRRPSLKFEIMGRRGPAWTVADVSSGGELVRMEVEDETIHSEDTNTQEVNFDNVSGN
jgi:hypothetical protein